jgi:hypothetical protein
MQLRASLSSTVSLSKGINNTHHIISNNRGGKIGASSSDTKIKTADSKLINQATVKQANFTNSSSQKLANKIRMDKE